MRTSRQSTHRMRSGRALIHTAVNTAAPNHGERCVIRTHTDVSAHQRAVPCDMNHDPGEWVENRPSGSEVHFHVENTVKLSKRLRILTHEEVSRCRTEQILRMGTDPDVISQKIRIKLRILRNFMLSKTINSHRKNYRRYRCCRFLSRVGSRSVARRAHIQALVCVCGVICVVCCACVCVCVCLSCVVRVC